MAFTAGAGLAYTSRRRPAAPLGRASIARSRADSCGVWRIAALSVLVALGGCGPSPEPKGAQLSAEGWHEFQGSWNAAGSRRVLDLGPERSARIVELTGSVFLSGPSRPEVGFRADAIGLGDTATGIVGRAAWTDDRGEQIYSEFRGTGTDTGKSVEGTFIGGTGRYAGATGNYRFTWQYVVEGEDGRLQGRATDLTGRVKAEQTQAATPTSTSKP